MLFRCLKAAMILILLIAAVIQYNDPDPIGWMLVYGLAAVLSAAHGRLGKARVAAPAALGVIALAWAVMLMPEIGANFVIGDLVRSMDPDEPQIEAAREAGGLLIVAAWMAVMVTRSVVGGRNVFK